MRAAWLALAAVSLSCGKELYQLQPFPCARDKTCPGNYVCVDDALCQPWETCELVLANKTCGQPALPRCTIVTSPIGGYTTLCVGESQSGLTEGFACTAPSHGLYTGTDGCATGAVCYNEGTALGAQEASNHCRMFCSSDGDCSGGNHCVQAFPGSQFINIGRGVCEPDCLPFGATCPGLGQHCDVLPSIESGRGILTCRANGTVDAGGNCNIADCKPGLLCIPGIAPFQTGPTCRVACDATHLCASGSCETSAYAMSGGTGFCH